MSHYRPVVVPASARRQQAIAASLERWHPERRAEIDEAHREANYLTLAAHIEHVMASTPLLPEQRDRLALLLCDGESKTIKNRKVT